MRSGSRRSVISAVLALASVAAIACNKDPNKQPTGPVTPGTPGGPAAAADPCAHDTTPPTIAGVEASRTRLWPPNHRLIPITFAVSATDACTRVTSRILDVTSDEPVNGTGDGNTSPDWLVTGPLAVSLRAERAGNGDGRVYTIRFASADSVGNQSVAWTTVVVPHDQGDQVSGDMNANRQVTRRARWWR